MVRFIHAADIHLDSPLKGISRTTQIPKELLDEACRGALKKMVMLAIDKKVSFVLLAGDTYDRDNDDGSSRSFFNTQMNLLKSHNIHVYMVTGNHDAVSLMQNQLPPPNNVRIFSASNPESFHFEKDGNVVAVIHGQSFKDRAEKQNLASVYPDPVLGTINIGLLHTSLEEGDSEHITYAPVGENELASKGYAYWALGHIHKRKIIRERPLIVYPGNPQGRNIKETGAKGCFLVEFKNLNEATLTFFELDSFRWMNLELPLEGLESEDEIYSLLAAIIEKEDLCQPSQPYGIRIQLKGKSALYDWVRGNELHLRTQLHNCMQNNGASKLYLEQVEFAVLPLENTPDSNSTFTEDIHNLMHQTIASLVNNPMKLIEFLKNEGLDKIITKLPPELKRKDDPESILLTNKELLIKHLSAAVPLIAKFNKEINP